ncbi:MAG: BON domain-containing protein, partial [Planctomycetota bacterium]
PAVRASADASDDRAAAQQIARDMKESGLLQDYRVGVKFQNGVAWLMGTVTSREQKAVAEEIARQSYGVNRVVSKLEIEPTDSTELAEPVQPAAHASGRRQPSRVAQRSANPQPQLGGSMPATMGANLASAQQSMPPQQKMPVPFAPSGQGGVRSTGYGQYAGPAPGAGGMQPAPMAMSQGAMAGARNVSYDDPSMPGYAWPSYAAYPNYAAVTYPQQYSPSAWPYIGPFYPYPQVPLGWRKVTLEWDDGWWFLDFKDCKDCY